MNKIRCPYCFEDAKYVETKEAIRHYYYVCDICDIETNKLMGDEAREIRDYQFPLVPELMTKYHERILKLQSLVEGDLSKVQSLKNDLEDLVVKVSLYHREIRNYFTNDRDSFMKELASKIEEKIIDDIRRSFAFSVKFHDNETKIAQIDKEEDDE